MVLGAETLAWCLVLACSGPFLILLNNYVYNTLHLPFPISVSALGIWGSAVIGQLCVRSGFWTVNKQLSAEDWMNKIMPISLMSAVSMALGNASYLYLSVAFTQMLKALTPGYVLLMMWLFNLKSPSMEALTGVGLLSIGTGLASVLSHRLYAPKPL